MTITKEEIEEIKEKLAKIKANPEEDEFCSKETKLAISELLTSLLVEDKEPCMTIKQYKYILYLQSVAGNSEWSHNGISYEEMKDMWTIHEASEIIQKLLNKKNNRLPLNK